MYDIPYFKASTEKEVIDFMEHHPFIILCGVDKDNKPVATHVPVLLELRDDKVFLLAHIMRKQDHSNAFERNQQVLAIFYGPHAYVSASWYSNQQSASTWNYQAVHATGNLKFLDQDGLLNLLTKLTDKFEGDPNSPSSVSKMDKAYVDKMMQAIVGFEIEVVSVRHVFKMSQNRDAKSYEQIINRLEAQDEEAKAVAVRMRENEANVFQEQNKG